MPPDLGNRYPALSAGYRWVSLLREKSRDERGRSGINARHRTEWVTDGVGVPYVSEGGLQPLTPQAETQWITLAS